MSPSSSHQRPGTTLRRSCRRGHPLVPLALTLLLHCGAAPREVQPWELWRDLHRLSQLPRNQRAELRSSRCPDGCRYDRSSAGDLRFLRFEGDEGVLFEELGPGAITRIWMTSGNGTSDPLDPTIVLRLYLDGGTVPTLEEPLVRIFDGTLAPFHPPLAWDRLGSSGGNVSYVPIAYQRGCKITLEGADAGTLWFQVDHVRLLPSAQVESFTGNEDLSSWRALLALQGEDPWEALGQDGEALRSGGEAQLANGALATLASFAGPDSLLGLELWIEPAHLASLELRLVVDRQTAVDLAVTDYFALGRGGDHPTRSLLIGLDDVGRLYSYFPIPFREGATIELRHRGGAGAEAIPVRWQVVRRGTPPPQDVGTFFAHLALSPQTEIDRDFRYLSLGGRGRLVGTFADLQSVGTPQRHYLEGDERLFLDGARHPSLHGTGVEDQFNGGFYFDQGSFGHALHGAPYAALAIGGETASAAYRLRLGDAVPFQAGIEAGLESGPGPPTGHLPMRARIVSYGYHDSRPGLALCDRLDLGDERSREDHRYAADGEWVFAKVVSAFEMEPPEELTLVGVERPLGRSTFELEVPPSGRLVLRRRLDAALTDQRAEVRLAGEVVGYFSPIDVNVARRLREVDAPLAIAPPASGPLAFEVQALPIPGAPDPDSQRFSEIAYELWCDGAPLFADGFERGDPGSWTATE